MKVKHVERKLVVQLEAKRTTNSGLSAFPQSHPVWVMTTGDEQAELLKRWGKCFVIFIPTVYILSWNPIRVDKKWAVYRSSMSRLISSPHTEFSVLCLNQKPFRLCLSSLSRLIKINTSWSPQSTKTICPFQKVAGLVPIVVFSSTSIKAWKSGNSLHWKVFE